MRFERTDRTSRRVTRHETQLSVPSLVVVRMSRTHWLPFLAPLNIGEGALHEFRVSRPGGAERLAGRPAGWLQPAKTPFRFFTLHPLRRTGGPSVTGKKSPNVCEKRPQWACPATLSLNCSISIKISAPLFYDLHGLCQKTEARRIQMKPKL